MPARQFLWQVELSPDATIGDAIIAARVLTESDPSRRDVVDIPWDTAPVGVFGEARTRGDIVADGDRVELYRPLLNDPRERRRARVQTARKQGRIK